MATKARTMSDAMIWPETMSDESARIVGCESKYVVVAVVVFWGLPGVVVVFADGADPFGANSEKMSSATCEAGLLLIHRALYIFGQCDIGSDEIESTYVDAPIAKYMRHVHMVAHGRNASQMQATSIARAANTMNESVCLDSCLRRRMTGSLSGIVEE